MRVLPFAAFALAATLALTAARGEEPKELKDVCDTVMADKELSTLVTAVKAAGLVETLKEKGPYTVFAPTNAAFEKVGKEKLEALLADKSKLKKVLLAHVIVGKAVTAEDVAKMDGKEVNGFTIRIDNTNVSVGDAKVIKTDIKAGNGVIHTIDTVLMPKE